MNDRDGQRRTHSYGSPDEGSDSAPRPHTPKREAQTRLFGTEEAKDEGKDPTPFEEPPPAANSPLNAPFRPPPETLQAEPDVLANLVGAPSSASAADSDDPFQISSAGFSLLPVEESNLETSKHELLKAVELSLARFALAGSVHFEGMDLVFESQQGRVQLNAKFEVARWERQDADARDRAAADLARKLAQRAPTSRSPRTGRHLHVDASTLGLACAAFGLIALLVYLSQLPPEVSKTDGAPVPGSEPSAAAPPTGGSEKFCEAVRGRVFRGGSIGLADAEGWVVEIAMLGEPGEQLLENEHALAPFFEPERNGFAAYRWKEEPDLALTKGSEPKVEVREFSLAGSPSASEGVRFTFSGSFVESYFDEEHRSRFYHLAHELSESLGPSYAAVYARCTHDDIHTLGSWFRGKDGSGAATSLLFFLGTYARPRHIDPLYYRNVGSGEIDPFFALHSIARATAHLDRAALSTLVGSEGGMAVGGKGQPVIITFPFQDGNRASRVSRTIARVTSLTR